MSERTPDPMDVERVLDDPHALSAS